LTRLGSFFAEVVVTDINMPDMDGIEIVTALREASSNVGVIAMSGGGLFAPGLLLDSAAALGADLTLEKPFDLDQLSSAIDGVLASRRGSSGRS
jgi:DNA-binding response OmpR family regulator